MKLFTLDHAPIRGRLERLGPTDFLAVRDELDLVGFIAEGFHHGTDLAGNQTNLGQVGRQRHDVK
jgi:hypothetical protein